MARDLRLDISGDASRARQALDATEDSVGKLRRETNRLEHEFSQANREAAALDRQLLETAAATKALNAEFARTNDKAVLGQLRAQRSELSQLSRVRKEYNTSLKDGRLAQIANHEAAIAALKAEYLLFAPTRVKNEIRERRVAIQSLRRDLGELGNVSSRVDKILGATLGKLPGLLSNIPGLGLLGGLAGSPAAGAVAAPVLAGGVITAGALAGGLTTAGIGAGVAGAGVAGAAVQSQAVRDEWSKTTAQIKRQFLDATTSFEQPTISAIKRIDGAVQDINMKKIFADASKFVEPLADGTAKAVSAIGRGVEAVVSKGGPAIRATGDLIANLGGAVEHAMETIAGGSEGGAKAIRDLDGALTATIEDIGYFVRGTEEAYNALDDLRRKAAEAHPFIGAIYELKGTDTVSVLTTLEKVQTASNGVTGSFRGMSVEIYNTADAARELDTRFQSLFGQQLGLDEANLAVKEGMIQLRAELKSNGNTLKDNTQAGIDNQQAILGQIGRLNEQREAAIRSGNGTKEATEAANAAYAANVASLRAVLIQMGFNIGEVDRLIAKYQSIPKEIDTNINTYHNDYYARQGAGGTAFDPGARDRRRGFASGTISAPPGWAWTGEYGPELMRLRGGEQILNTSQSKALMSSYALGTTARPTSVNVTVAGGGTQSDFDRFMQAWFMKQVRIGQIQLTAS